MDALGPRWMLNFKSTQSLAIQGMDRDELEEAFVEMLHQKAHDRQMFLSILKDHGTDAEVTFNYQTFGQIS